MADGDGITDVEDISGNGKGVALNVYPGGFSGGGGGFSFVTPQDFGAVADGVTDDSPAFIAALDFLREVEISGGYGAGIGTLFVPKGTYYLGTTTLELSQTTAIVGETTGSTGGAITKLMWAAGTTGIRVHAYNTTGASGVIAAPPDNIAGSGSLISGLFIQGGYAGTEGEFHGIHLRGMALIEKCYIRNWPGDGIYGKAAIGGGVGVEGNVNLTHIYDVVIEACRHGIYLDSADSNACTIINANAQFNRAWGIWDSSFLGNSYFGCHTAANGWDGAIGSIPTACTYSGNRYYVISGQETWCGNNAPTGTTADNQGWGYKGPGGAYTGVDPWVGGGQVFRSGGAIHVDDNNNSAAIFLGCYSEGDQNPSQLWSNSAVLAGGLQGAGVVGSAIILRGGSAGAFLARLNITTAFDVIAPATVGAQFHTTSQFHERTYHEDGLTSNALTIVDADRFVCGRTIGVNGDTTFDMYAVNGLAQMSYTVWNAGVPTIVGNTFGWLGAGFVVNGNPTVIFRTNNVARATLSDTALNLAAGVVYQLDGVDVRSAYRIQSVASAATVTPTFANDQVNITALAAACQLMNWTGTAVDSHGLVVRIKDNGTARALTYDTKYRAMGVALPTTTVINKTMYLGFIYNLADDKYDLVSVAQEA